MSRRVAVAAAALTVVMGLTACSASTPSPEARSRSPSRWRTRPPPPSLDADADGGCEGAVREPPTRESRSSWSRSGRGPGLLQARADEQVGVTAPDVQYEDTFKIQSDAAAGYLLRWTTASPSAEDWSQFATTERSRPAWAGRQDLRRLARHRHPRPLVQHRALRAGRHRDPLGARYLAGRARRGRDHQRASCPT